MMATNTPENTFASMSNSQLNTPKLVIPENHAHDVLCPANFSLSPVKVQEKLKPKTPPGILALRAALAELDQQLMETSPTVSGRQSSQASSQEMLTPDIILLKSSPPKAPATRRHRLRRQHAIIEGVATPTTRRSSPPTPPTQSVQMEVDISEKVLQELQSLRKKLSFDDVMEQETENQSMDVDKEDEDKEDAGSHLPASPVLMAVKAISGLINESVHESCEGCKNKYPSQKDHEDCIWLPWEELVDKYFDKALNMLNEERFFWFADQVYNVHGMFEDEYDYCVAEAAEFFNSGLKKKGTQSQVKRKVKELPELKMGPLL
nr:uncharacterized protein LOC129273183 [Lytechinus pictus]